MATAHHDYSPALATAHHDDSISRLQPIMVSWLQPTTPLWPPGPPPPCPPAASLRGADVITPLPAPAHAAPGLSTPGPRPAAVQGFVPGTPSHIDQLGVLPLLLFLRPPFLSLWHLGEAGARWERGQEQGQGGRGGRGSGRGRVGEGVGAGEGTGGGGSRAGQGRAGQREL